MNSKRPAKFFVFPVFGMFSTLLILTIFSSTIILLPIPSAFAESYGDGYGEGCYDAGRDLKGLNGHGYDESVSHGNSEFHGGYVNGYRACWDRGDDLSSHDRNNVGNSQGGDIIPGR
jgi:hypothetical protein